LYTCELFQEPKWEIGGGKEGDWVKKREIFWRAIFDTCEMLSKRI